jgi:hypothetical protein
LPTLPTLRRPKPFWWPSNSNADVVAARSADFIRAMLGSGLGSSLAAMWAVDKVAWADLRG